MICKYRNNKSGHVRGMECMFLALKNYIKIVDKDLSRSVMHYFFYSNKDKVEIPYITLGSKDSHVVIFEIKSLNIKRVLSCVKFQD